MIVVMRADSTAEDVLGVLALLERQGLSTHVSTGEAHTIVGVLGSPINHEELGPALEALSGVDRTVKVSKSYKLASRQFQPTDTVIDVRGVRIGGPEVVVIAGPCSAESEDQCLRIGEAVARAGARLFRAGAYKPRTSPYAFRGHGEAGLEMLAKVRETTGLPIVTEVLTPAHVELVGHYTDVFQIGARNMQNYLLLEEVGRTDIPVLLKRGPSATIEEWLLAAEYVMAQGNRKVILCERGIRTYETATRNTFDVNAVAYAKRETHLPVIADPSHGTGVRPLVSPVGLSAIAAGADGLIVEVHHDPDKSWSDAAQALGHEAFAELMATGEAVARAVGRKWAGLPV
ncbi:3-deoxy-7-phosphoheptulonate synthase [bacterium]|nr:3-deoxy-7-phosphoheptulonate synthase [bacterium]